MRCDIVPVHGLYRGVDRHFTPLDFISATTGENMDEALDKYFSCQSELEAPVNPDGFAKLLACHDELSASGVLCDLIAYDTTPLNNVFGRECTLLGIDIVRDSYQSLLGELEEIPTELLNENMLCRCAADAQAIAKLCGENTARPCWVYRVV